MRLQTFPWTYAVKHKDIDVRMNSRSGGVFTALSDYVLDMGGIVYGAILDAAFDTIHYRATTKTERDKMRGSKYVQSLLEDIFIYVKADLEENKTVLFSGTLCQIAGLKGFLNKEYANLLCIDIVCHGVPSPKVWRGYLSWQKKKHGDCISVDFRNKRSYGWADHVETLTMEKHGISRNVDSRVFATIFYGHNALRPSCHSCPYKDILHPGDITIADFWEIDRAKPGYNDNKGISLVFVNNPKGAKLLESVSNVIEMFETEVDKSIRPSMLQQFSVPPQREEFWRQMLTKNFTAVARNYGSYSSLRNIKQVLRKLIGK